MPKSSIIFKSKETIYGYIKQSREGITYAAKLTVKGGGKKPVTLEMKFVPPHPFIFNMPESHQIKAESITNAYVGVIKYFRKFGAELIK